MKNKFYSLPNLKYDYGDLEPFMSKEQLSLHHDKHHLAYVNGANSILERMEKARKENKELDFKAVLKELSFHRNGHLLHCLFWDNMRKSKEKNMPEGYLLEAIKEEFSSFERFKTEFSKAAVSVEGSGWAALAYDKETNRLLIMQIEKHNLNIIAGTELLLVLDVWEHSYYLDYKNDRQKFIDGFWDIISWQEVSERFKKAR